MPEPTIRTIGGTWTPQERACAVCGEPHNHLTDLSDGRAVCMPCAYPILRPGAPPGGER